MKISLGSDHAGFRYKEKVKELLISLGHEVKDCGSFNEDPVIIPSSFDLQRRRLRAANASAALFSAAPAMAKR